MPRLFTGLEIPTDVAADLDMMRGGVWNARWIDPGILPTSRCASIGDIDDGLAREVAHALDGVMARPFTMKLKGVGAFGGNKPHSLYAGVSVDGDSLKRLQATQERVCQMLGLPPEQRRFRAARHAGPAQGQPSRNRARLYRPQQPLRESGFEVSRFVLFSSRPREAAGRTPLRKPTTSRWPSDTLCGCQIANS